MRTQRLELQNAEIDLGLAVLAAVMPPDHALTQQDIADVCGCSQTYIYLIEQSALQKLRRFIQREGNTELCEAFRHMLQVADRRAA